VSNVTNDPIRGTAEIKAVELPEKLRRKEPEKPKLVKDLQSGGAGSITVDAVYVDRQWRVWIDPTAPVEWQNESMPLPADRPLYVIKRADGLDLYVSGSWVNSPNFDGFERNPNRGDYSDCFYPALLVRGYQQP